MGDGINTDFLRKLIDYWINTYDFQKREKYINKYPHFITNIREFYDFIPTWTTLVLNKDILYEMIIPSLPGFGFSTSTVSHMYMSTILQDLTFKLSYKKFDIQGGNSFTYCVMPRVPHAKNFSIIDICNKIEPELHFSRSIERIPQLSSQMPFKKSREFLIMTERRVGAVSEDVLAIGLRDSPVALAAYILEGYLKNINCAEKHNIKNLNAYNCNKLIDNLMIYWVSQDYSYKNACQISQ